MIGLPTMYYNRLYDCVFSIAAILISTNDNAADNKREKHVYINGFMPGEKHVVYQL